MPEPERGVKKRRIWFAVNWRNGEISLVLLLVSGSVNETLFDRQICEIIHINVLMLIITAGEGAYLLYLIAGRW